MGSGESLAGESCIYQWVEHVREALAAMEDSPAEAEAASVEVLRAGCWNLWPLSNRETWKTYETMLFQV